MRLTCSCHCKAVRFTCDAYAPAPYNRCYCSICRKTGGSGGFGINIGAKSDSLVIEAGEELMTVYRALLENGERSPMERRFCSVCGSNLYGFDPRWPDLIHPFASCVDTPLPEPPEIVHMMVGSKREWVRLDKREGDREFAEYPDESLEAWHRRHGLLSE